MKNLDLKIKKDKLILKDLIIRLSKLYGVKFKNYVLNEDENRIHSYIIILINEVTVDLLDNLNSILKNNDTITFLPSIHGGTAE